MTNSIQDNIQRTLELRRNIDRAYIPHRFAKSSFEDYVCTLDKQRQALAISRGYAEQFENRERLGGGLVFCGSPGTGKTHLACAIANHVLADGKTVLFMTAIQAVRRVKMTYRHDSEKTEQQAFHSFLMPDLLILDEVGAQWGSDAEKLILFEIFNDRYANRSPVILVSNLDESELTTVITLRAMDRLRDDGGVVVAFDWESYRGRAHG